MKKLAIVCSALAVLATANAASAADLPMKAAPYVSAPAFSWTGIYIGVNGGYAWGRTTGNVSVPLPGHFDINGWTAGGQIGGNYQIQNFVLGIEADYDWADISGSRTNLGITDSQRVHDFGTVRGRLGYAWDRWMVYGTGGWAFGAHTTYNFVAPVFATGKATLDGWTAGAGVEWAFAPNWSAKLEYLHIALDDRVYPTLCVGCTVGADIDTVRVGVNWRFGLGPYSGM